MQHSEDQGSGAIKDFVSCQSTECRVEEDDIVSTTYQARPILHVLIGKKKWQDARNRIESNPEECRVWVITEFGGKGSIRPWWKRLPVHVACERNAPVDIVKALIDSYPESIFMKDENGKVPLIHACYRSASIEVVKLLLSRGQEAASLPDLNRRLALHWACEYDAASNVVSALLASYPDASKHVDEYGRVPLHWVCVSIKCRPQTVQEVTILYPNAVSLRDLDGNTPLDLMKDSISQEKEKVIEILNGFCNNAR